MSRRFAFAAALAACAIVVALFVAAPAAADGVQSVFVTNFPSVFKVDGSVAVKGPLPMSALVARRDVVVPPVFPKETTRLIDAGTIDASGFSNIVLSLSGQIKGEFVKSGTVGAILLPDEEPILRAFDEKGQLQFQLEVSAGGVSSVSPYFASNQPRFQLGFPRYRVYLYNTAEKTVTATLYAYLTN
jgi:hypothetical protein